MDPTSLIMAVVIYGCTHHAFGPDCDQDAQCWQMLYWRECHERFFGDIHTPQYLKALKDGRNIKPRFP